MHVELCKWYRSVAKMEILSKLGCIAPVCEGAGSHFILEQSLVIFVKCPRSLVTSSNTFGQTSYVLAM